MATIDEVMAEGWRAFQAGDLDRAERAYRLVLTQAPATARAWFMLGAIGQLRGRTRGGRGELPGGRPARA